MKLGYGVAPALGVILWCVTGAAMTVEVAAAPEVSGCVTSAELSARLVASFDETERTASDDTLLVSIVTRPGGLVAKVAWWSPAGRGPSRELELAGSDCRQFDDALPLIARALWDGEPAPAGEAAQPPAGEAPLLPPPPTPMPASTATDRAPPPPTRSAVDLGLGVVGLVGVLDEPGLAARLEARVSLGRFWALRLAGTYLSEREPTNVDGGQVRFSALTGRFAGCWVPQLPLSVDACLAVDAGVLMPRRDQLRGGSPGSRPLLWPLAIVAARQPLIGPLVAQASFAAGPALTRYDFQVTNGAGEPQSVRAAAPALLEVGLSLGVALR